MEVQRASNCGSLAQRRRSTTRAPLRSISESKAVAEGRDAAGSVVAATAAEAKRLAMKSRAMNVMAPSCGLTFALSGAPPRTQTKGALLIGASALERAVRRHPETSGR